MRRFVFPKTVSALSHAKFIDRENPKVTKVTKLFELYSAKIKEN